MTATKDGHARIEPLMKWLQSGDNLPIRIQGTIKYLKPYRDSATKVQFTTPTIQLTPDQFATINRKPASSTDGAANGHDH